MQKIFRKLNMRKRQIISDGVKDDNLTASGIIFCKIWKFWFYSGIIKCFVNSLTYNLQEFCRNIHSTSIISYYRKIPPLLCEGFLCLLFQVNRIFWTREWYTFRKGSFEAFIFLEEDLTMLPHDPHQTNQGSIWFHSFTSFTFMSSFEHWGQCSS